ncbi:hypothetical protein [uncultured Tenacibaculum sp.]|uniref:hypothetical protein n=1 Tax=uncultured Tenacibaculum sp. TaxID=174713 RepID=UPI002604957B|nr:hypothetical protein [uncultured Tenacibaculum sp.]
MIYINPNDIKIKETLHFHYKFMFYVIKKKINGSSISIEKPFSKMKNVKRLSEIPQNIIDFLNNDENLKTILCGLPHELNNVKDQFNSENEKDALKRIFNYNSWVKKSGVFNFYSPYDLSEKLKIDTCTYCNRLYTKTVIRKNNGGERKTITRPEFDHWFPKSDYPILALSFFNLIPSCHVCNSSVKGVDDFSLNTHLHPYVDNFDLIKFRFSYSFQKTMDSYKFKIISGNEKTKNTVEAFKLDDIYKAHEDEIKDLVKIRQLYSDSYLENLSNIMNNKGVVISNEEMYRLAFSTQLNETRFKDRPLSRMKRDILKELGIIKP